MIYKVIKARVKPGHREAFIAKQRVWNDGMARQRGFLGVSVATDPQDAESVHIFVSFESKDDLEHFMAGDHDALMAETGMDEHYEELDIQLLDVVEPGPPAIRLQASPTRTGAGYQIALLSELYRVSATLRTAVEARVFDRVGPEGMAVDTLAAGLGAETEHVRRLLEGLGALNLAHLKGDRVHISKLAKRHLCSDSPGYMGDLVLHNTRPALWQRWGELGNTLGLNAAATSPEADQHALFLDAMSAIAQGGQAQALLSAIDLSACRRLLDIGGAHGDYSVALCRAYPELECVLLDQPPSRRAAIAFVRAADLSDRIEVLSADYRKELPVKGFDAVLLSNVLRGETLEHARALLKRIAAAMHAGALLIIQDLFVEEERSQGPLLAAMFGLHLPDSLNGTVAEVSQLVVDAGFGSIVASPLDHSVMSNRAITARRLDAPRGPR